VAGCTAYSEGPGCPCATCSAGYLHVTQTATPTCAVLPPSSGSSSVGLIAGASSGGAILIVLVVACILYSASQRRLQSVINKAKSDSNANFSLEVLSDDQVAPEEVVTGDLIGQGQSSRVYKATWHGTEVAAKVFIDQTRPDFIAEVSTSRRMTNHPRVVQFLGAHMNPPHRMIILKLMECGSIEDLLVHRDEYPIHGQVPPSKLLDNVIKATQLAVDCSAGLLHCHFKGLIHRDVRTANFLVTLDNDELRATIADFGLSRFLPEGQTEFSDRGPVPVQWLPHESLSQHLFSKASDVYMFGMVLYEVFARRAPFEELGVSNFIKLSVEELRSRRPNVPARCPKKLHLLMGDCWREDPKSRISMNEVNQRLVEFLSECAALKAHNVREVLGIGDDYDQLLLQPNVPAPEIRLYDIYQN